jgi:hypothetical protein
MADRHENNKGFRLLDEFVCHAIPDPSAQESERELRAEHGANQGARVLKEAE